MDPTSSNFGSINELNPIGQQHQINIPSSSAPPLPRNLPCADLLGSTEEYHQFCVPLYKASISGDWEAVKVMLDKRPELIRFSITERYETILHVAVLAETTERFLEELVHLMEKDDFELYNRNCETALHIAAAAGNVQKAKIMVNKNKALLDIPDSQGRMPLYFAALFGKGDMVKFLYDNSQHMTGDFWTHERRGCVLLRCVEADLFDVALQMVNDRQELAINGSVLGALARKPRAYNPIRINVIQSFYKQIYDYIRFIFACDQQRQVLELLRITWTNIVKLPKAEVDDILRGPPDMIEEDGKTTSFEKQMPETLQLLRTISENIVKVPTGSMKEEATTLRVENPKYEKQKYSSRVLFVAAEMGNTAFLRKIILEHPYLALEVNDNNQSIFHVAVSHRHKGIYSLLYKIGSIRDSIVTLEDKNGNNMLHLVGILGASAINNVLKDSPGVALQMQQELSWFKKVEAILPPYFREKKNADGLTPHEVFTENHKDLVSKGEQWMKETATQLMVVAALIATISFAAIITFAGGYNQETGNPMFLGKENFTYFLVFNTISFGTASASILAVLSLLTSRYAESDFLVSLPNKLMLCLTTLFFSITSMIIAFYCSISLLYENKSQRTPHYIFAFSVYVPYTFFYPLLLPLFGFLYRSIFFSKL